MGAIHKIVQAAQYIYFTWQRLPKWVKRAIAISVISKLITYVWMIFWVTFPSWENRTVHPFLCPWYHDRIGNLWMIKNITDDYEWILFVYAVTIVAKKAGDTVFLVFFIIFAYHVFDHLMFWWDKKSSYTLYIDTIWVVLLLIWTAIKAHDPKKLSRIKSLF